jgi:hypothetical protein
MKLEDQVVSLELAKKLKELGVKQESLFSWFKEDYSEKTRLSARESYEESMIMAENWSRISSAYTVAELGEMLPPGYGSHKVADILYSSEQTEPHVEFSCTSPYKHPPTVTHTEADARAKMLISLIENNIIMV